MMDCISISLVVPKDAAAFTCSRRGKLRLTPFTVAPSGIRLQLLAMLCLGLAIICSRRRPLHVHLCRYYNHVITT